MLGAAAAGLCSREGAVAAVPVATASSVFAAAGPVAAAAAASPQLDLWLRPAPTSSDADAAASPAPMLSAAAAGLCSREGADAAGPVPAAGSGFAAAGPVAAATPALPSSVFAAAGPAERAATAAVLHSDGLANALAVKGGVTHFTSCATFPQSRFGHATLNKTATIWGSTPGRLQVVYHVLLKVA